MVGGRRRNPRAHQGADVKIGPAASNSFSRMLGSWLGITRSHRIRGWQGVHPVSQIGVHRDQQLAIDTRALIRGFRSPAPTREIGLRRRGRRSKASLGGNRGTEELRRRGARYGDLMVAVGSRRALRIASTLMFFGSWCDGGPA
jgi:hypothetical protein